MTKKELLEQVEFLKSRILFLESLHRLNSHITVTPNSACEHEYPNPWMATIPPNCKKCGKQAAFFTTHSQAV